MLLNENTVVSCSTLSLWPYRREHVPRYHAWMQDEEIRQLTASEPLSLQKEYDMQASWREDTDKLTFIVVRNESTDTETNVLESTKCMIGDVNLFVSAQDVDDQHLPVRQDDSQEDSVMAEVSYNGELELMIAEGEARGQGHGKAALLLFISWILHYKHNVVPNGNLSTLVVKIGIENKVSLNLFEKIGFAQVHYSEYFRECELHLQIEENTKEAITSLMMEPNRSWSEKNISRIS